MNALWLRGDRRNATKSEFIEKKKKVHFRFKSSARGTTILCFGTAVNTQGIRFRQEIKTITQTIENERAVSSPS